MADVKPGWKSTEGGAALIGNAVAIAILTGHLTPEQGEVVKTASTEIITNQIPLIVGGALSVITNLGYIISRSYLKKDK